MQPLLAHAGAVELIDLRATHLNEPDATDRFCREKVLLPAEELDPPPLVEGADLIAAGAKPGPAFKELLARARAAQLDGEANTKSEAMRLLGFAPSE